MNLQNLETKPDFDYILKHFSEESIFSYYMNIDVVPGKRYKNPFREDKNASCYFKRARNGRLFFIDHANPESVNLGIIDVVMKVTGLSYLDALVRIKNDLSKGNSVYNYNIKKDTYSKESFSSSASDIKISLMEFNEKDYQYWQQFGISKDTLEFYDVRKVGKAWINDSLWYLYNQLDPCYRYKENGRFKLYRPLALKVNKFRSNLYGGLLEGYTQLPERGDILIITKSRKDVMTLYGLGFNAVSVRSESTPLSDNAYNLLKNRFNKIFLWFDPDEAGEMGAQKLSEKYNLKTFKHDISYGKDPSDIYKNKGKEFLNNLIIEQLKRHEHSI